MLRKILPLIFSLIAFSSWSETIKIDPVFDLSEPESEGETKLRDYRGDAFINFKTGKANIDTKIGHNKEEIDKILQTINSYARNNDVTVNRISIVGYASPEGVEDKNLELSEKRMKSLFDFIKKTGTLSDMSHIIAKGGAKIGRCLTRS